MFLTYLIIINITSAIIFAIDKKKAKNNELRVPELALHIYEMSGGVFSIFLLMYVIRHKNQKKEYYQKTYLALIIWVVISIILGFNIMVKNFDSTA